jgi:hypothetical protein
MNQTAAQINAPQTGQVDTVPHSALRTPRSEMFPVEQSEITTAAVLETILPRFNRLRVAHGAHHSNLRTLVEKLGAIGERCGNSIVEGDSNDLADHLRGLAAFTLRWLPFTWEMLCSQVVLERARQDQLLAAGKFPFNCANTIVGSLFKLPILTEEVGEVGKAILETDSVELSKELIQVAAVCVAWLEALEAQAQ